MVHGAVRWRVLSIPKGSGFKGMVETLRRLCVSRPLGLDIDDDGQRMICVCACVWCSSG